MVRHQLDDYPRQEREPVKPAACNTLVACEEGPTGQSIQDNEQALERLLLRYLRMYRIVTDKQPNAR